MPDADHVLHAVEPAPLCVAPVRSVLFGALNELCLLANGPR